MAWGTSLIVKSIRVRLLLWYAVVLTGVVVGFAGLLYYKVRAAKWAEADAVLESAAAGMDASLRLFPPVELLTRDKSDLLPPKVGPNGKGPPPPPKVANRERLIETLGWPGGPEMQRQHPGRYFAIWRADGSLLKSEGATHTLVRPTLIPTEPRFRTLDGFRELVVAGPRQSCIVVGMPVAHLDAELRSFVWQLVLTGSLVLLVGLSGGWLVSRTILRPVQTIADTASRITGNNLAERIDERAVESELAGLAGVLNATFDRLQDAFDRQTQFTADASHELRTPLAVLRSQAELTLARSRTEQEYRQAIEACLRAALRMTELVEKLLLLARADSGATTFTMKPLAWGTIIQEVVDQLEPLAQEKGIALHVKLKPVALRGDAIALAQVVSNLITNAIQYNRVNGRVQVRLRQHTTEAELEVRDTGPGIPQGDQPHLFERFYRVDKARQRGSGGTGLGLAICQSIVLAHGGSIGVESQLGEGSTFWVRLPLLEE